MWPAIVKIELLNPMGVKWSIFAEKMEPGPNAYQKPENRGGFERTNDVEFSMDGKTMYVADYGELHVNYQMESPFYTSRSPPWFGRLRSSSPRLKRVGEG